MLRSSRAGVEQPARILIVDDDEYVARTFEALLRDLRPTLLRERTATDGLAAALASDPDVALIDVGLPDLDGLALTRRLRAEPSLARLRIVIVTGHLLEPGEADRAGADATILKPLRIEELRAVIVQQLERAAESDARESGNA